MSTSSSRLERQTRSRSATAQSGTHTIDVERRDRILFVEDDRLVRAAFVRVFVDIRVDVAPTVALAEEQIRQSAYLAWIVDEHLPDGSGLALVEAAREAGLRTPAMLVTGGANGAIVNRAQLLGIEVAFKPDVQANVRAFLGRARASRCASPAVLRATDRFAELHRLTPRERDVLRAIGRGVPRARVAEELVLSENSIKTLVRRILRKADVSSLDDALRLILRTHPERAGDTSR